MTGATAILDLERAGFTREQVEALARWGETQAASKADLAATEAHLRSEIADVRADITEVRTEVAELRSELRAEIAEVRHELRETASSLRADIARVEASVTRVETALTTGLEQVVLKMTVRLGGLIVAGVIALGAILRLFPGAQP